MKMTIHDRTSSIVLAGLVLALAAGCGDDSSSSVTTASDGGTTADGGGPTSSDEPTGATKDDDKPTTDDSTPSKDDAPTSDDAPSSDDATSADDTSAADDSTPDGGGPEKPSADDSAPDGGEPPTSSEGDGGGPGPVTASGDINDLISAVCDWEFRCCDRGELDYRLGPSRTSVDKCVEVFTYELTKNSTQNDYAGRQGLELLGVLAFSVDLDRVEINAKGVSECIAEWQAKDCNQEYKPVDHCAGPVDYSRAACDLSNLFKPKLADGDECTIGLTETGAGNDIECLPGSTCLPAGDPENPNNEASCVSRALDGEPCNEDRDCDFNFYCAADGSCAEKGDEGDPCSFADPELPKPGEEDAACKLGLSCHPIDLVCVNNCSKDFPCADDSQCPSGQSCAPFTVGDDSTSFHVCRELGANGTARCDNDADCVKDRYCGGGICAADANENDECSVDGQCPEGTYCSDTNLVCQPYTLRGSVCARNADFSSEECEPAAVGCIFDGDDQQLKCSSSKNSNGDGCAEDYDCKSGLCELATSEAPSKTCVAGAAVDDDCDEDPGSGTALRCAPGAVCFEGACRAQLAAGGDCTGAGDGDSSLCANSSCVDTWETHMCTDAPAPSSAGGSGVMCDGK
ncbi:MAG TPA: hypothetical protein VHM70_28625 [Polyangiaceae bacterium]|jgi:hypothetical protein|nr:hypothetical protein [Polyangiaceae bacterium]